LLIGDAADGRRQALNVSADGFNLVRQFICVAIRG
jgi:hypothetical protein